MVGLGVGLGVRVCHCNPVGDLRAFWPLAGPPVGHIAANDFNRSGVGLHYYECLVGNENERNYEGDEGSYELRIKANYECYECDDSRYS